MNRRLFLLGGAAMVAGCTRRAAPVEPTAPELTIDDFQRLLNEQTDRDLHLGELNRFRVEADAVRTSAPPPADILAFAPELKPLVKVALRLHPRFGDEPEPERTKLGGRFRWPASEPWPHCDEHRIPYVTVLQLRADDAPPQFAFRSGTDLLQLLWCPRDHGDTTVKPLLLWRKLADQTGPFADPPAPDSPFFNYVPVPCRVFPERVAELPPWDAPPKVLRDKLATWTVQFPHRPDAKPADYYTDLLSAAAGTKVGGYPRLRPGETAPQCATCKWGMDYLLTVAEEEWSLHDRSRWQPLEERKQRDVKGYQRAAGLHFGKRNAVQVFVCRRCADWPVKLG